MTNNITSPERAGVIQHLEEIISTLETEQSEHATTRRWKLINNLHAQVKALKLGRPVK